MSTATEHVYTLADLENWPPAKAQFPANGVALAVIGHPVAHSLSPAMHNAALARLAKLPGRQPEFAKFANWRYYKFDIPPENLGSALELFYQKKFWGLNLTVPHKTMVLELKSRHFQIELQQQFLREMGAANTLKWKETGWYGYNTDGFGLKNALLQKFGAQPENLDVILLGAGGAARAAAMMYVGISKSLWIGNRTEANRAKLIGLLKDSWSYKAHKNFPLNGFDPQNPPSHLPKGAIVINATSLGLKNTDESPLDLTKIPKPAAVFDMIYRPAETALLRQAKTMNLPAANGLSMLVFQGASSLQHWLGEGALPPEILDEMHHAVGNEIA